MSSTEARTIIEASVIVQLSRQQYWRIIEDAGCPGASLSQKAPPVYKRRSQTQHSMQDQKRREDTDQDIRHSTPLIQ